MSRYGVLAFSLLGYAIGFGGLAYFMLFVGGWEFLPVHVDSSPTSWSAAAVVGNVGLIALFGVQHSVMARAWFKRRLERFLPRSVERSLYGLMSGLALFALCLGWRSVGGVVWQVDNSVGRNALVALYAAGWSLAVATSFAIDHLELFGLRQGLRHFFGVDEPAPSFTERWLYRFIRHPLQSGVLIGLWATPVMTVSHLMLSATMTVYIMIGLSFEERSLEAELGDKYRQYRKRVPMLLPLPKRTAAAA